MNQSKIPTAEEFMTENDSMRMPRGVSYQKEFGEALIEFAKLHVKAALEAAAEKALIEEQIPEYIREEHYVEVNKDSITNAYPESNIK